MELLLLFTLLMFAQSSGQIECPDDMEVFLIDYQSIEQMKEEAKDALFNGEPYAEPVVDVSLWPNKYNYDEDSSLNAFEKSGTFIWLRGLDSYIIKSNKRDHKFLLKFVIVETRFIRVPAIEFFAEVEGEDGVQKVYLDKVKKNRKLAFTKTIFPHEGSQFEFYSQSEPMYLNKIRIAFRTTAGNDTFALQNLLVVTCVDSLVV